MIGLAIAGFAMSYEALHSLAVEQSVPAALAWMWPLVVDGFIVLASVSVVRAVADGRHAVCPWLLVLTFSSISVAFNVVHAAPTQVARLVAAIPPAALALSFELLMRQLRADRARGRRNVADPPVTSASEVAAPRRRNAAETGERLLVAAGELFAERGYERTRIPEVGQCAGADPTLHAAVTPHTDAELQKAAMAALERRLIAPIIESARAHGSRDGTSARVRAELAVAAMAGVIVSRNAGSFVELSACDPTELARLRGTMIDAVLDAT